jgi:hypothetical protein
VALKASRSALLYAVIAALYIPIAIALAAILARIRPSMGVVSGVAMLIYMLGLVAQSWSAAWNVTARVIRAPEIVALGYCAMAIVVVGAGLLTPATNLAALSAIMAIGWTIQALVIWSVTRRRIASGRIPGSFVLPVANKQ